MSLSTSAASAVQWTPVQQSFRNVMKALRGAYFHDRSKLFWARHRALVEYHKFATVSDEVAIEQLVGCANEVAVFMSEHMKMSVDRIIKHNEMIQTLPVDEAKRFRTEYLLREKQHDSWCKQKVKVILERRPVPPHPFC